MLIECRSVWELVHFLSHLHHLSHTPTASSFNSNSFLLSSSSSLHTHLFTCHFLFLSITVSLHFPFLCHHSPSPHLLYLYPTTFSSLLVLPLFSTSVYMQIPHVHHLSALTHKFTLLTVYLLLCAPSSITSLSFAFLWFLFLCSSVSQRLTFYFIFLQDVRHSSLLSPPSSSFFIPHTTLPPQHAASCPLLLYSSQQWVSDLNLSLCITGPPLCSSGTPSKTNSGAATLPCAPSFMCVSVSVCNWAWNDKTGSTLNLNAHHLCCEK